MSRRPSSTTKPAADRGHHQEPQHDGPTALGPSNPATAAAPRSLAASALDVQRTAGNRAVNSLLSAPLPEHVDAVVNRGGGRPLDAVLRTEMEGRFGQSFGDVRLHTDAAASASAAGLDAAAYAIGTDIVVNDRSPSFDTAGGKYLLSHELAHVVQQRRGGAPTVAEDTRLESGAHDAAAGFFAQPGSIAVAGASAPGLSLLKFRELGKGFERVVDKLPLDDARKAQVKNVIDAGVTVVGPDREVPKEIAAPLAAVAPMMLAEPAPPKATPPPPRTDASAPGAPAPPKGETAADRARREAAVLRLAESGITLSPDLAAAFGVAPPDPLPKAPEGGIDQAVADFAQAATPTDAGASATPPPPFGVMPTGMGVVPPATVVTPRMEALMRAFSNSSPQELLQAYQGFESQPEVMRQALNLTPEEFEALRISLRNSHGDRRHFVARPAVTDDVARRVLGLTPDTPITSAHLDQLEAEVLKPWYQTNFIQKHDVSPLDYDAMKRYFEQRSRVPDRLKPPPPPPDPNMPVMGSGGRVMKESEYADFVLRQRIEAVGTLTQSSAAAFAYGVTKIATDDEELAWDVAGLTGAIAGVAGSFGHAAIERDRLANVSASQPPAMNRVVTINAPGSTSAPQTPKTAPTTPPPGAQKSGSPPVGAEAIDLAKPSAPGQSATSGTKGEVSIVTPRPEIARFGQDEVDQLTGFWRKQIENTKDENLKKEYQRAIDTLQNRGRVRDWKQSEEEVRHLYSLIGGKGETAYLHGRKVDDPAGVAGVTKPDVVPPNAMGEVKNWEMIYIDPKTANQMMDKLANQVRARSIHGPADIKRQTIILDLRGQKLSDTQLQQIGETFSARTGVPIEHIQLIVWAAK